MAEPIDFSNPQFQEGETPAKRAAAKERDVSIRQKEAAATGSEVSTQRTLSLLPSETTKIDAEAKIAQHKANTLGFEKADADFQQQLVAWRAGDAASFFEKLRQLRNAVRVLKSGKQLTGPMFGQLPDFVKAAVSPQSVDVRGDVEKVIQQTLRETLGAQFTQQEGSALLARTYNPALPESYVADNVEAELNTLLNIGKSREAMARYYEANGTLKGYNPDKWVPTVEKQFKVEQGMSQDDKLAAAQNAMVAAQGQIGGEGIKGIRFRPAEEAALLAYVNSDQFTPAGYASMIAPMYEAVGANPPPRSLLLEDGREIAARPVGARAAAISYEKIDEGAMKQAGFSDVAIQAFRNLPESGAQFAMSLVSPLTDAVKSVVQGERAGVYKTIPDLVADIAAKAGIGETDQATLNALSDALTERYGGMDALKSTLVKDPIGLAGDLSILLTAGGTALQRAPGRVGALGETMQAAGAAIDPLSAAMSVAGKTSPVAVPAAELAGKVATEGLAFTSGAPTSAIREAAATGFERQTQGVTPRTTAFRETLTGEGEVADLVTSAKDALAKIREQASQQYRSGMVDIAKDQTVLAFDDLDDALSRVRSSGRYKDQVVRKGGAGVLDEMEAAINDWRALDPVEYHTPEGFDALKQRLGDIRDTIPADDKVAQRVATQLYNAAKKTIRQQAPAYDKVMGQYKGSMDEIKRMEQELGIGTRGAVDTAFLKLTSRPGTRPGREALVDLLAKYEPELGAAVAGEQLSALMPRGLRGVTTSALAIPAGLYSTPVGAAYGAMTIPRVVGEMAYGAGRVAGGAANLVDLAQRYPASALATQRGLATAEMTEEEQARALAERYGLNLLPPLSEDITEYAKRGY